MAPSSVYVLADFAKMSECRNLFLANCYGQIFFGWLVRVEILKSVATTGSLLVDLRKKFSCRLAQAFLGFTHNAVANLAHVSMQNLLKKFFHMLNTVTMLYYFNMKKLPEVKCH